MKIAHLDNNWAAILNDNGTLTFRNLELEPYRVEVSEQSVQKLSALLVNDALLQIAKEHEKAALYYARKAEAANESSAGFRLTAKMARDLIDSVETPKQPTPKPSRPSVARRTDESDADYIKRLRRWPSATYEPLPEEEQDQ